MSRAERLCGACVELAEQVTAGRAGERELEVMTLAWALDANASDLVEADVLLDHVQITSMAVGRRNEAARDILSWIRERAAGIHGTEEERLSRETRPWETP